MAKTKAKSIDKKSSLLSANDDKYLIADNSTLPILNDTHFNDVAASNQQATTRNPFAINPGGGEYVTLNSATWITLVNLQTVFIIDTLYRLMD